MSGDRERYLAAGMNGYVSKPIEQRDLLTEIARLLGSRPPLAIREVRAQGANAKPAPTVALHELADLLADMDGIAGPRGTRAEAKAAK